MLKAKRTMQRLAALSGAKALLDPNLDLASFPKGWLAALRRFEGLSQRELGERLGISGAAVSKLEKGECRGTISLARMQSCAKALGCRFVYGLVPADGRSPDDFFNFVPPRKSGEHTSY